MENVTSIVSIAEFMTRVVLVLFGLRVLVWWLRFDGEKPVWLPFSIFKAICSFIGVKQPIEKITNISELTKFQYIDKRFQDWRNQCLQDGKMTMSELLAFDYQTLIEIEYVLKVKTETQLDA